MPGEEQLLARDVVPAATDACLDGGGELGALMRAFDWTKTPLGPSGAWPRSLKTAVRIMLTSQQPFWLGWGPELTYLYNDAYKSIIGGKHPHALGRPFSEVWKEIWDVVGPMADRVVSRDEGIYVEAQLLIMERHGYQEETYYTFSYSPVPDDDGGIGGLICANTEATGRVIGERQLALLGELAARGARARTWQDACRLAIEAMATNGRDIPFALVYAATDEGASPALCAATPGTESLHDPARWPITEVCTTGEARQVALGGCGNVPQGDWSRAPEHAAVLRIGNGVLVVGLNPYRRFDTSYRAFLGLVAGQVSSGIANAQAYEEERRRAEALAELDRAKTTFFSNVSHEFRTPLTLMLGPVEELLAKAEGDPAAAGNHHLLQVVHRNSRRLLKLVNTLLDFARLEAGRAQVRCEPTDLGSLTADLAANFRAACERAGLALRVDSPASSEPAWVDRDLWEKIVLNLVSNAFKFTLAGEIAVTTRETGAAFVVTVRDTGSGIPPEAMPNLFQRFYRVDGARGRSHEGSGIGLALVNELVRQHGGQVSAKSEPGKGSEFTVSIPRGHAHLPPDRVAAAPAASNAPRRGDAYVEEAMSWLADGAAEEPIELPADAPRVLVADDNADLRDYLRRLLRGQYHVEVVSNGEEALAAAQARPPDVIVSDVMMPRIDGLELVARVRDDPRIAATPIVLLSARAGEEARIAGMGSGADDYLVKPFNARELLVRVGALIRAADVRRRAGEELARRAAQFEALLNAAPLGIYLVDDAFRIAAVNPVAAPFLGSTHLVGQDFDAFIRRIWPAAYADDIVARFRHTLATGEGYVVPERAETRRDSGVKEYYEWQVHRIPLPGGRFGAVCYFRDISRTVLTREALEESDRRKDEFLATLSHELRNPLAPIRNSLHILGLTAEGNPSIARVHEIMQRQVNHMVRLVDDLLEMSRISRGKLELRKAPVELATVVRAGVETAEPLIQASGHRLEVNVPPETLWLDGDAVRLGQVLGNVLNNAAKYSDRGGWIGVEARREGGEVAIRVRDTGEGIAEADLERIFDMFARGEDRKGHGGLGIGLALARRLVEMHGGTIRAASPGPGQGSEFTIRLPLAPEAPGAGEQEGDPGASLKTRRILVVDDNRDAADSLAMILRILGAAVRVESGGAEALKALAEFDADVALLDIGMPGMDGYELARAIRAREGRQPMLVALTGWGQEQDRQRARQAGFDHHLVKPADIEALNALLAGL